MWYCFLNDWRSSICKACSIYGWGQNKQNKHSHGPFGHLDFCQSHYSLNSSPKIFEHVWTTICQVSSIPVLSCLNVFVMLTHDHFHRGWALQALKSTKEGALVVLCEVFLSGCLSNFFWRSMDSILTQCEKKNPSHPVLMVTDRKWWIMTMYLKIIAAVQLN